MKALLGVASLLVVLAIVGMLAVKQLGAARPSISGSAASSASGTLQQQSQRLQKQVANDVAKALEQGAAARKEDAEK